MKLSIIALAVYQLHLGYHAAIGETLPDYPEVQAAYEANVAQYLDDPELTPELSHERWAEEMAQKGWVYGEEKDAEALTHPLMLPYAELSQHQKIKDALLFSAVSVIAKLLDERPTQEQIDETVSKAVAAALESATKASTPAPTRPQGIVSGGVAVKYIGRRDSWTDGLYGSGLVFAREQVRTLPSDIAGKLLRHPDVFEKVDVAAVAQESAPNQAPTDDTSQLLERGKAQKDDKQQDISQVQDLHDMIDRMENKNELAEFALHKYQQKLNKSSKIETMRTQVKALIDQYGVV